MSMMLLLHKLTQEKKGGASFTVQLALNTKYIECVLYNFRKV